MISLAGKVISVTGSASGIGLATAKALFARGACLSLADRREDALNETRKEIESSCTPSSSEKPTIIATVVDVRESSQVDSWIEKTASYFGRLDGAANIAGVLGKSYGQYNLSRLSNEEWDSITRTNLTGLFYCMRAQLRVLSDGGAVVNAASVAGLVGSPTDSAYCATKHAVIGLSKSAAQEFGGRGIRVNCVAP